MNTGIEGHTELPWDVVPSCEHHGPYIVSDYGSTIADLYTMSDPSSLSVRNGGTSKPIPFMAEMADANAAFIVQAVNSHDDLVAALEAVLTETGWKNLDAAGHGTHAAAWAALKAARGEQS